MKQVHTIAIPAEGIVATVAVPEGGKIVDVVVGPGYQPAVAVLADTAAAMEERQFFVTRGALHAEGELKYLGSAQEPQRAALYVFEICKRAEESVQAAADAKGDKRK